MSAAEQECPACTCQCIDCDCWARPFGCEGCGCTVSRSVLSDATKQALGIA